MRKLRDQFLSYINEDLTVINKLDGVNDVLVEEPVESIRQSNLKSYSFPGIRDSDIHMAVIESYGAVLVQRSEYRDHIMGIYNKLSSVLEEAGMEVRSGYVNSPAFGGEELAC